ncbi:MAG: c-type cytochrome [Meiothermus sp.]|nr:c-type cytochrome [Meiothermus sp.]
MKKSLISGVVALGLLGALVVAAPTGNVANGTQLYTQNCMGCHGAAGAGGLGPALAGAKSEVTKWTFEVFKKAMMEGVTPAKTLKAPMPVWSKTNLRPSGKPPTDQDLADMLAYFKSVK